MKQLLFLVSALQPLFTVNLKAQKTIAEGTFHYDVSIQSLKGDQGNTNALQGAAVVFYIKGVLSRMDMLSSLGSEKTIYDSKQGAAVVLKEYSGQKLMITLTKENWADKNKRSEGICFNEANETKTIEGYTCHKATAAMKDGSVITAFYTRDLVVENREYNPLFKNLRGVPLYYEVESGNLKFIYNIRSLDFSAISQTRFEWPKTGYRVISYDENRKGGQ